MAMEIHFCDLCNESVPQSDLDLGRAFLRRGRVICTRCERAMTHDTGSGPHGGTLPFDRGEDASGQATAAATAPAVVEPALLEPARLEPARLETGGRPDTVTRVGWTAPVQPPAALIPATGEAPAPARSSSGLVLAMVALVFAAGAVAIQNEQIRDLGEREVALGAQLRTHDQALNDVGRANDAGRDSLAAMSGDLDRRFEGEREGREIALAAVRAESDRLKEDQQDLAQKIDEFRNGAIRETQDADRRSDEMSHRLAKSEDENRALLDRIAKLEAQIEAARTPLAVSPEPSSGGPGAPEGEVVASGAGGWMALVPDLASPKAATRWVAVDQIGQSRDPESIPFLVPMLKDADVFVRMATARVLGDIQVPGAVPALIDALEDGEAAVREAALGALRTITGKDLRFDPLASDADRAKKVKAWRDWWKKVEEEGGPVKD